MSAEQRPVNIVQRSLWTIDDVLRGRVENWSGAEKRIAIFRIVSMMLLCGGFYGAVMGSFSQSWGEVRGLQMLYSATKVPLLLLVTFAISLPSFFVANTLLGLRTDFGQAIRAVMAAQAALTIVLAGLAPLTLFVYASGMDYDQALAFNALIFAVASFSVQILLWRLYRPLIRKDSRHRLMIMIWVVIYGFVGIQMGWVLRPFIGTLDQPTTFFREGAWGNAYLVVFELAKRLLTD
jgi:hypothetical protein